MIYCNVIQFMEQQDKKRFFNKTILSWFKKNGKKYPWRNEKDPYRILIAEIMLQRTRVTQVIPVYQEFIKKYPDINSASKAEVKQISTYVKKLGLFWRSKLIKEMITYLVKTKDGKIPSERNELLKIPGVGDYIADAMISFAFNKKRTIIDSNVVRLVSRFFGIEEKGELRRNKKFINFCQELTENMVPVDVKRFNWGMIDFAADVCKSFPLCVKCSLSAHCIYYDHKKPLEVDAN